ncbi:hypothetical protein [Streptomyces sp. NPDC102264]|uniref:hypothetical protein n=1 Tax=Streptomyces sp. NPDC102264 TaxID=3366149 RepID=UPI0037F52164
MRTRGREQIEAPICYPHKEIRGSLARLIVCSRPCERTLAAAAARTGTGYLFRPTSMSRGSNTVTNFISRARRDTKVPRLVLGRCRATWLVDRMNIPIPLPVLLAAAGLDSLHAFSLIEASGPTAARSPRPSTTPPATWATG